MEDRNESLKRLYVIHPAARGLSDEGHCRLLTVHHIFPLLSISYGEDILPGVQQMLRCNLNGTNGTNGTSGK